MAFLQRRMEQTDSEQMKERYEGFMRDVPWPECDGTRLKPEILAVTLSAGKHGKKSIAEVAELSIADASDFLNSLTLGTREQAIAGQVLKEIQSRLGFLLDVGLEYLSLSRAAATLSGGEAQRIRLATQIGSGLVGVLYVLDEPSIGLHQRDNRRLYRNAVAAEEPRQHAHRRGARSRHHRARRLGGRHRADGRRTRRADRTQRHLQGAAQQPRVPHRRIPFRPREHRGARHPAAHRPQAAADGGGRSGTQPARNRRVVPTRGADLGHRRIRLREVDTGQRHPRRRVGQQAQRRQAGSGQAHPGQRPRPCGQAGAGGPVAHRSHTAVQPGDLYGCVRQDPLTVRRHYRGQGARVSARPVLVQRQGRSLRGLLGRRHHQDRDELPARCLCAVRGLQRSQVQPGNARGALQGQDRLRGPRHVDRGRGRVLRTDQLHSPVPEDAGRRRPRIRAARPTCADVVRRRGAAGQAVR